MSCTIWSDEVIRKVELTECRMLLDSLADGDAASYHRFIICEIQD